jgi:hypothetical protein
MQKFIINNNKTCFNKNSNNYKKVHKRKIKMILDYNKEIIIIIL